MMSWVLKKRKLSNRDRPNVGRAAALCLENIVANTGDIVVVSACVLYLHIGHSS